MRLELTGRHLTITPALRQLVEQRLSPVLRTLNDSALSAQVVLTRERSRYQAEVTLHARGEHFLHSQSTGRDGAIALSAAIDKIDRQVEKLRGKWNERKRRGVAAGKGLEAALEAPGRWRKRIDRAERGNGADDEQQVRIIRARRYAVKPMSVDEAALEVTGGAEAFLVFRNAATDTINVLFRRPDGNLGLIEPDA